MKNNIILSILFSTFACSIICSIKEKERNNQKKHESLISSHAFSSKRANTNRDKMHNIHKQFQSSIVQYKSNQNEDLICFGIVLAGGSGKRLWPLSREKKPKQFIEFANGATLLGATVDRIQHLVSPGCLWAVTTQAQENLVRSCNDAMFDTIIIEPLSRNTGPALLLAALKIYAQNPDALLLSVHADHHIPDQETFVHTMKKALKYAAQSNDVVLLGIQPRYAASEYGYIEYGSLKDNDNIYTVTRFHEKPSKEIAQKYIETGNMLWNSGIFCAKVKVFLDQAEKYAPELLNKIKEYVLGKISYNQLPDISFDKAILEHTVNCSVVPAHFQWSDVGSLEQFLTIRQHIKKYSPKSISIGSQEHLIDGPKKLVILLDIETPLCVLEMDDVLFITHRNQSDRIKEVIKQLNIRGLEQYT